MDTKIQDAPGSVVITIAGKQDGVAGASLITEGTCKTLGGRTILEYAETDLSGLEGCTACISIGSDDVYIERRGAVNTQLQFKCRQWSSSSYNTPDGRLDVDIFPTLMQFDRHEASGRLSMEYQLLIGSFTQFNQVCVEFTQRS